MSFNGHKAAVYIFIAMDCPISNSYAPEISRIIKANRDKGLDFFVVYSDPAATADATAAHAKAYGYACPALLDTDQKLMKKVKATVTPEAAVVDGKGAVLYLGRIDNWYEDFGKQRYQATTHDLQDALDEIVAGKKVTVGATRAIGCPI